jgi:hypothetical protein
MTKLGSNISYWVNLYEPQVWTVDSKLIDNQTDNQTGVGYLLAQAISFPAEEFSVTTAPVPGSGGFGSGYVGDRRSDYGSSNKIDISFLETNRDIIDFFIRPWVVACSYKGLIEDDEAPIKCNIVATLYSRAQGSYKNKVASSQKLTRPQVEYKARKQLTFKDCAPTNIEADKISYNDLSFDELVKTVSFIFSHYTIKDISRGAVTVEGVSRTS